VHPTPSSASTITGTASTTKLRPVPPDTRRGGISLGAGRVRTRMPL
jgi:hypothetical protein